MKKMMVLMILIFGLSAMAQTRRRTEPTNRGRSNRDIQTSNPRNICLKAAFNYFDRGEDISPYEWCADVTTMGVAVCRSAALDYKYYYNYSMNVATWCSDVNSYAEGICRQGALAYKSQYRTNMNVTSWCSDVRSVQEADCRSKYLIIKAETGRPSNVSGFCSQF